MLNFKGFINESLEKSELINKLESEFAKYDIKKPSSLKLVIYVPSKKRIEIATHIAQKYHGSLARSGPFAGKPVVEFDGLKVFVKPIPGTGVGGTAKEDAQLMSLQKQIERALSENDLIELPIKIGKHTYMVAGAATTPGTPKSDFHLLNKENKPVVWISHKDGSTAKDFQQWSGMTETKEKKIYSHPETQRFIADVIVKTDGEMPTATTYSRKIKDETLKKLTVYGNNFGDSFGINNVTLLLQGPVSLEKEGSFFKLTSNHDLVNGEDITGEYEPVFMAIYKGDRSNFGVQGARFGILPKGSRNSTPI